MPEMKFCIDCQFYQDRHPGSGFEPICKKEVWKIDLVFGKEVFRTCEDARGLTRGDREGLCGFEGRWWTPCPK